MTKNLRGEIYNIDLNPTRGSEIKKARPCVIVSNDTINANSSVIVVCPITDSYGKFSTIHIRISGDDLQLAGLEKESVIHCGQIRAIDKERIGHKIGQLPDDKMDEVIRGLKYLLDFHNPRPKTMVAAFRGK